MLEHVEQRPALFADMKRVLRPGGCMIHCVPSASWRLWTPLANYPDRVRRLFQIFFRRNASEAASMQIQSEPCGGLANKLRNQIWAPPHGVDGSALKELVTYSRWGWRRSFKAAGLNIHQEIRAGILYTGFGLFPWLGIGVRKYLAKLLGSSSHVFVLHVRAACQKQSVPL